MEFQMDGIRGIGGFVGIGGNGGSIIAWNIMGIIDKPQILL